jgi:hypothetical protein
MITLVTWWVTKDVENETRRLKRQKVDAAKRGETMFQELAAEDELKKNRVVPQGIESA